MELKEEATKLKDNVGELIDPAGVHPLALPHPPEFRHAEVVAAVKANKILGFKNIKHYEGHDQEGPVVESWVAKMISTNHYTRSGEKKKSKAEIVVNQAGDVKRIRKDTKNLTSSERLGVTMTSESTNVQ